jgi:hypothetical protein
MSGDQQYLIQNLKNMIDYIHQDTKNKVEQIRKDAQSESVKGMKKLIILYQKSLRCLIQKKKRFLKKYSRN